MLRNGLAANCESSALGSLIDLSEEYMREIMSRTIMRARLRLQESQPNMSQARGGDQTVFTTTSYGAGGKPVHLVPREPLHLICTDNRNKELSFLAAKDAEQAKIRQHQLEQKS